MLLKVNDSCYKWSNYWYRKYGTCVVQETIFFIPYLLESPSKFRIYFERYLSLKEMLIWIENFQLTISENNLESQIVATEFDNWIFSNKLLSRS